MTWACTYGIFLVNKIIIIILRHYSPIHFLKNISIYFTTISFIVNETQNLNLLLCYPSVKYIFNFNKECLQFCLTTKEVIHLTIKGTALSRPSQFIITHSASNAARSQWADILNSSHSSSLWGSTCVRKAESTHGVIDCVRLCMLSIFRPGRRCDGEEEWMRLKIRDEEGHWCVSRTELLSLATNATAHVGL